MSDECKYYYYDCGYCCMYKREHEGSSSVDSDWVHRYCWGYNYEECPIYKKSKDSSGCFLTSACVEAKQLPDDCDELQTLRKFRDTYVREGGEKEKEIEKYYQIAPAVVAEINKLENRQKIWESLYEQLVLHCVKLIKEGKNRQCYEDYKKATLMLEEKYVKKQES